MTTKEGKVEENNVGLCSLEGKRLIGRNGGTTTRVELEGKEVRIHHQIDRFQITEGIVLAERGHAHDGGKRRKEGDQSSDEGCGGRWTVEGREVLWTQPRYSATSDEPTTNRSVMQ